MQMESMGEVRKVEDFYPNDFPISSFSEIQPVAAAEPQGTLKVDVEKPGETVGVLITIVFFFDFRDLVPHGFFSFFVRI